MSKFCINKLIYLIVLAGVCSAQSWPVPPATDPWWKTDTGKKFRKFEEKQIQQLKDLERKDRKAACAKPKRIKMEQPK